MNETEINKVQRFINDPLMSGVVYGVLRDAFLKKRGPRDVQVLAAERLAVDLLDEGWQELLKHKINNNEDGGSNKTPHV